MSTATATGPKLEALEFICDLVQDRAAIVLEPSKAYLMEARLAPLARQHGLASVEDLVMAMRQGSAHDLQRQAVEAMTTNETSFFRDLQPFEAFKEIVLPELLRRQAPERSLNIWSNACSSGQEPYSLAMILRECAAQLEGWNVRLVASDLSSQILQRAREGLYNQTEVNRGLPVPLLLKYFQKEGLAWRIKDEIRRMVEFRELNLIAAWPANLPPMDVVFLRNVLIYFSADTKKTVLAKVRNLMRPGGYLFLGGAETTINLDSSFQRVTLGKAVCYRSGLPAQAAAAHPLVTGG